MDKTILITGASSGLGRACAERLAGAGHRVYAASRRAAPVAACTAVAMDVDDEASVTAAVARIRASEPRIDVLINCAGFGIAGAIEDTATDEAKAQFETNFFGATRVVRSVLPQMRAQGGGLILNVSSLVNQLPVPFQGYYCASKAALHAYTEALRYEVAPLGIRVAAIEPGNFATGFTGARRRASGWTEASVYAERCAASIAWMEEDERKGLPPARFAERVHEIVMHPHPKLRHLAIAPVERVALLLRALLPSRAYEWIFSRVSKAA
ncbi:SDR family oxidoreductase [Fontimonas sp. SYSU GA230001]|uniref:SDR family oxidoreductase n=1 Tax=Fontimonas sp. SYSU GA230001 TaxID=3142450 RepID=UPI0032B582AB